MAFVYPGFLFALFAVLIPVIIHLFYFRRYKKVVFSDIRFLKEIKELSHSSRNIRDWLLLLCRIGIITFLVFAFAQPFIPFNKSALSVSNQKIGIYLDNSFSMLLEGKDGPLFEEAKNKARAIVNGFGEDARYYLQTNTPERIIWYTKQEMLQQIDGCRPHPSFKSMKQIEQKFNEAWLNHSVQQKSVYVISDFQSSTLNAANFVSDTSFIWHLLPVVNQISANIYIDSVWSNDPIQESNKPVTFMARIRNNGDAVLEGIVVSLKINGAQKAIRNITVEANSFQDVSFSFVPSGSLWHACELSLEDYPITFDDKYYFVWKTDAFKKVLSIVGDKPDEFVNKLFTDDKDFRLTEVSEQNVNYSSLPDYNMIVLGSLSRITSGLMVELVNYVSGGGNLLVLPPTQKSEGDGLNELLQQLHSAQLGNLVSAELKVERLNITDPFFKGVFTRIPDNPDMPSVKKYYTIQKNSNTRGRSLMQLNNGQPFLWMNAFGRGKVVVSSVPLHPDYSNFQSHALFVPTILKLAMGNASNPLQYYSLLPSVQIKLPVTDLGRKLIQIKVNNNLLTHELQIRDGQPAFVINHTLEVAGNYPYFLDNEKVSSGILAFNYNRKESELESDPEKVLSEKFPGANIMAADAGSLVGQIQAENDGKPLWKMMLWIALLFLLAEVLIIRFWKIRT